MKNKKIGTLIIIVCSVLWAISGICGQLLFSRTSLSTPFLTMVRLAVSGLILSGMAFFSNPQKFLLLFKNKKDMLNAFIFSVFGCMAVQYSYFAAIEASNAATGTILQYMSPIFVVVTMSALHKKLPTIAEGLCCILAVAGVFLVSTGGNIKSLSISPEALFWGIFSAGCLAYYNIAPVNLVKKYGAMEIVGLGMLLGSVMLGVLVRPFGVPMDGVDIVAIAEIVIIIIFGTIIPFAAYPKGVAIIGSTKSSIIATSEPMSAFLISLFILGEKYPPLSIVGFFFIVLAVIFITLSGKKENNDRK